MYGKQVQLAFAESPCKRPPSVNLFSGHLREPMISCAVGTTVLLDSRGCHLQKGAFIESINEVP